MSVSTGNNELSDDDFSTQQPTTYQYDLRLEIGVKSGEGPVPVASIFHELVQRMKSAADEGAPLVVLTATDKMFFEHKELPSEEFQKAFQVENVDGKVSKVLLGFKIRTLTKLSEIKRRLMHTYLIPRNLFLRQHVGGFENGVKTYSFGFLKDDHPDHPDVSMLNQRFARIISEAWQKLDKEERKKWRQEVPNVFFGKSGIMLPITFTKERLNASCDGKDKIVTYALVVSSPTKYGRLLKVLLDTALKAKRINNLIPFALSRDNMEGYYYIVAHQARFIENHRNIPIMNVPASARVTTSPKGETLVDVLHKNSSIQRVAYDPQTSRYHVSTIATKYREVHQWINSVLAEHKFPFSPSIRPMKFGTGQGSNSASPSYGDIFKDTISIANESYTSTATKTTTSNAWKTRPPLAISYSLSDAAFPALPVSKHHPPTTPSTTSETLDEDTIQSAISTAIKKLEEQHRAELNQLKKEMQSKIDEVTSQMKELGEQVAIQTYQALLKDESPLATKTDHAHLQNEMTSISNQLTKLITMLQNAPQVSPPGRLDSSEDYAISTVALSRNVKRAKPTATPEKASKPTMDYTQDCSVSSASSTSSMEGCEY